MELGPEREHTEVAAEEAEIVAAKRRQEAKAVIKPYSPITLTLIGGGGSNQITSDSRDQAPEARC